MTAPALDHDPRSQDLSTVRDRIASVLEDFFGRKARATDAHRTPEELLLALREFCVGGKLLRPLLCVTGWHAAQGRGSTAPALRVGAALEMFHAFALIHDDIMDKSATRRGRPTVHRAFATRHHRGRTLAAADHLGAGTAILVGDLALVWSDELLHTAGLTPAQLGAVLPLFDTMRTELMYGQYLDLTATGTPTDDTGHALAIARYKTAKYTIERPLHIGAALAGGDDGLCTALSAFALPLGEAFQLRDDILGVYGDPAVTGKPCLDDLRDGKHTALVALAVRLATPAQRRTLTTLIGSPQLDETGAGHLRRLLTATGARQQVEHLVQDRLEQARQALENAPVSAPVTAVLRQLAHQASVRTT